MEQLKPYRELKRMAKIQMQGKLGVLIGALVLEELLILLITSVVVNLIPGNDTVSNVLYYLVTFIIQLLLGMLSAGMCYLHLHAACNMETRISDLFYVIKTSPDKAIKLQVVLAFMNFICMLPADYLSWKYGSTLSLDMAMNILTATMIGSIIYLILSLGFFPVFYLMLDFPSMTAREIYEKSWELMKGQKLRYLGLQLSFIPVIFLSMFTFGIALLWVIPYMSLTGTNFYLNLVSAKNGHAE